MTVHIEVRAPEDFDSDYECEDTVSEVSDSEDEGDYAFVLEYNVDEYRKMFQSLSLEKAKLESEVRESSVERHLLEDRNEALKKKLASGVASSSTGNTRSDEPRKRFCAVRPQRPITNGVLDLDDSVVYRNIDYVEGDEPVYRTCDVGEGSEYIDDEEPVYRDAGVVCPVAFDVGETNFSTSKSDDLRQVVVNLGVESSESSHKRSASQPQPSIHVYRKANDEASSSTGEPAQWKEEIEKNLEKLKEVHATVKKTVEDTVGAIRQKETMDKMNNVTLDDEAAETESDDDDEEMETDPKVQEILSGLASHVQKNECVTTLLAKRVAKQEVEIMQLKEAVRKLTEFIVSRETSSSTDA